MATTYDIVIVRHQASGPDILEEDEVTRVTFTTESPTQEQSDDEWMVACAEGFARHVGDVVDSGDDDEVE